MRKISIVVGLLSVAMAALAAVALASSGDTIVKKTATVPPSPGPGVAGHAAAKAKCPSGTRPEGIGVSTKPKPGVGVIGMRLSDSKTARAALNSFNDTQSSVKSIAYCAKNGVKAKVRSKTATVGTTTIAPETITASCKDGEQLMFGGFKQPEGKPSLYLAGQYKSGQGWTTEIFNFDAPAQVTSYAYCSKDAPKLSTVKVLTSVSAGSTSTLKPDCHDGKHVVSGGYTGEVTTSNAFVLLRTLQRKGSKAFKVVVRNENPSDIGDLTAYAYCAKN